MAATRDKLEHQLNTGLLELGLDAAASQREGLLKYLLLVQKWSAAYNLTAIRDPEIMVPRHLLDSLSAADLVHGVRLADIGSGAGLPGIPLAVVRPDLSVTLIESRKKKAAFLLHVAAELELPNVNVVCRRVENYQPPEKFDTLATRAFASLTEFVDKSAHLCAAGGRLLALKGIYPEAEIAGMEQKKFVVIEVRPICVPGLKAQRHIVVLCHCDDVHGRHRQPTSKVNPLNVGPDQ